jgi:hypothetical protein
MANVDAKRKWHIGLCSCCNYVDRNGKNRNCPECFQAMCCANAIAGKTYTRLTKESPICCQMGCTGLFICITSIPFSAYHPMGSICCMGLLSNYMRARVVETYNVQEEDACANGCTCGCSHDFCNQVHYGCNYPCSFFQMMMSMEEWDAQLADLSSMADTNIGLVHGIPVVIGQPVLKVL